MYQVHSTLQYMDIWCWCCWICGGKERNEDNMEQNVKLARNGKTPALFEKSMQDELSWF